LYVAAPAGPIHFEFAAVLRELEVWRHTLNWVKDGFVLGRADYHYRHEPIFYGWKEGAAHTWNGGRSQDSVLEFPRPRANKEHPTMKPVALIQRCLENSTDEKAIVCDPFGGSGSTLIACEATNRRARLIELDPRYCDVIVRRWEEATGKTAVRHGRP
jgi:site-specific DNA-methyltransferase (adenine-specific)